MTDREWHRLVSEGGDEGWRLVWERVVEPESKSLRSAEMMKRYSLTVQWFRFNTKPSGAAKPRRK